MMGNLPHTALRDGILADFTLAELWEPAAPDTDGPEKVAHPGGGSRTSGDGSDRDRDGVV